MFGCATVKYKAVPPIQKATNEYFKSTMEPVIFLSSGDSTSIRPLAFALARQAKLGASCRVQVPVG